MNDLKKGQARVLQNQVIAEENAEHRFKFLKFLLITGVAIGTLFTGAYVGWTYMYIKGPGFLGLVPESYGRKSYNELMDESLNLKAEVTNLGHLWHSHNMLTAIADDDPTRLEKGRAGRDGKVRKTSWDFFQNHATKARMAGFLKIVHAGQHPNLEAWYSRIKAGMTELEQLRELNKELESFLSSDQREVLEQLGYSELINHKNN